MARRFVIAIVKGALIGAAISAAVTFGLGLSTWGALSAYALAVATGAITGLLTGKPVWAKDAKLEAGLRAAVGAFIAAVAMFGARKWAGWELDLSAFGGGAGRLGELPMAILPIIALGLTILFEIDDETERGEGRAKHRIAPPQLRVDDAAEVAEEDDVSRERSRSARPKG